MALETKIWASPPLPETISGMKIFSTASDISATSGNTRNYLFDS
jgi:hypothetical protein